MMKALFLDIDGTLILRGRGPFADDIAQIEEARRQGCRIFLSTGRAFSNIPPALRDAPYIDGVIAGGGAHITLGGKTIYRSQVPGAALDAACDYYMKCQKWCVFEGETRLYGIGRPDSLLFAHEILAINDKSSLASQSAGDPITKLTIEGRAADAEHVLLGDALTLNQFSGYFEGIIRGESKSKGMKTVLRAAGIAREDTAAIGDSVNDLDMLAFAALGIAMGNACDEVKRAAGHITADCGAGGVALAIQNRVLRGSAGER